jgi:DDB1- and CUL4-associated factor 11
MRSISLSSVNLRDLAQFVTVRTRRGTDLHAEEEEEEEEDDDEWDEEDEGYGPEDENDSVSGPQYFPPVKEAQKAGEELLYSGDFGRIGIKIRSRANNRNLVKSVLNRATHLIPNFNKEDLLSVCFNFLSQNHELNWVLSTRTSFQIPMELQLQPTRRTCILLNFQMVH